MAKTDTDTTSASADTASAATASTAGPEAPQKSGPTPDNTPLPGGGSFKWDISLPGWVDVTHAAP